MRDDYRHHPGIQKALKQPFDAALVRQVRTQPGCTPQPSAAVFDIQSVKACEGGEARGVDALTREQTAGRRRHIVVDKPWACC